MQELRANTQVIVHIGPFVDVGDGFTPQTDIALAGNEAEIQKHGGGTAATVDISGRTWGAITNCRGWYCLTLTTDDTDTPGCLTVVVQDDSDCLPVKHEFMVLSEYEWDRKYATEGVNSGKLSGVMWYGTFDSIADSTIVLPGSHNLIEGRMLVVLTGGTNALGKARIGTLATNTITVDPAWNSDSETTPSGTLTGYVAAMPKSTTSSIPIVNTTQVSGTAQTAGDLAALINTMQGNVSSILTDTGTTLDDLLDTLVARLTAARAGYLDNLSAGASALEATAQSILTDTGTTLEGKIDTIDGIVDTMTAKLIGTIAAGTHNPQSGDAYARVGAAGASLTDLGGMSTTMKAQINTECLDVLNTDTFAEPGQGAPGATITLAAKIGYIYKAFRNKFTQTSTTGTLYNDDGTTAGQVTTVSDDGATFTRGEMGTGA